MPPPASPAVERGRRRDTLAALEWLRDWRPTLIGPNGRPVRDASRRVRRDGTALPQLAFDVTRGFGIPDRLVFRPPPQALPPPDAGTLVAT